MGTQPNNPWQVVGETPLQSQPAQAPSTSASDPWKVVGESPTQTSDDPQLAQQRAANDARPWWRKALGLAPASSPEEKAKDDAFWAEQKTRMEGALKDNFQARADVPIGIAKAASRTAVGTDNLVRTGLNKLGGDYKQIETPDALKSSGSFGQEAGGMFEGVLEFIAGDEALKTLSVAEKFGLGVKIAKLAEEHPAVAKLIHMGLNATRTGAVSGVQEAVHGGDTGDVLTAAGTGALSSAASEGLGALAKLAKPGTKQIAGETVQTAPLWKGAATAGKLAEANQEPAQQAIGNVARDSADAIMKKFGQDAPETIRSFGDAAKAVQSAAKPVFEQLDALSNGEFQTATNELNNANKIARRATSMTDLQDAEKAATKAQSKIDQIFKDSEGKIAPEDLSNARSAWRSGKILEKLHGKIDQAHSIPQSAGEVAGTERTLQLQKLQGRLNAAFQKIPQQDLEKTIGQAGTKSLLELAQLGADPERAKTLGDIARQLGEHLSAGGAGVIAGAALGHGLSGGSLALGAHFLYSHPEAGSLVVKALSKGTNPKLIVPAVLQLLQQQEQPQQ